MKNKFWNKRFFLEAVRQLKIPGIIGAAIYAVLGIMIPIGVGIGFYDGKIEFSFVDQMRVMMGIPVVFVSIMMLVAFNFLNKRNTSDFYHSLPIKRESMYIHYMLAVICWALFMVFTATVAAVITVAFNRLLWIDYSNMFLFLLEILAGIILVAGGFGIGVAVTGTAFTNFVVAVMIVAVPDIIFSLIREIVNDFTPYIPFNYGVSSWFLESHNILFYYMEGLFSGINADMGTIIYSIVLGLVFMFVGLMVFRVRKSETASKPSLNGFWQTVFRMAPAFLISLAGCYYILDIMYLDKYGISELSYTYYYNERAERIFYVFLYYVLAIIAYFLYELVTTRKWKQVGKSVRFLPILVILNLVVISGIWFGAKSANEKTFEEESVEWIKVESVPYSYDNIILKECNEIEIYSDEVISEIVESYNRQCEAFNNNDDMEAVFRNCSPIDVAMNYKGRTYYREVYVEDSCINKVLSELVKDDAVQKVVDKITNYKFHDFEEVYLRYLSSVDYEKLEEIYNTYIEELKESDDAFGILSVKESLACETIICRTKNYENTWTLIISAKTPKTLKLLNQYLDGVTLDNAISTIEGISENNGEAVTVGILLQKKGIIAMDTEWYFETTDQRVDILKNINGYVSSLDKTEEIDGENLLVIRLGINNYNNYNNYQYKEGIEIYNLSDEEVQKLQKIISSFE